MLIPTRRKRPCHHGARLILESLEERCLPSVVMVRDINPDRSGSAPGWLTEFNDTVVFSADDGTNGRELWSSDGTKDGTSLVRNIGGGAGSSNPANLVNANGLLIFLTLAPSPALWRSDGTTDGTERIESFTQNHTVSGLTHVDGTVFYVVQHGPTSSRALEQTDGYVTRRLTICGPVGVCAFEYPTEMNGSLYVVHLAPNWPQSRHLRRTDGTTGALRTLAVFSGSGAPRHLTAVGKHLFFSAADDENGRELWKTDGTEEGTVLVKNIRAGAAGSDPRLLTNIDGMLYFTADDGQRGVELWRSDGTEEGTVLVADVNPGSASSDPQEIAPWAGGYVLFSAVRSGLGREPWYSGGDADTTGLLRDVNPGPDGSDPASFRIYQERIYFAAYERNYGLELWHSDGSEKGTVLAADINPGPGSSTPFGLVLAAGRLFFAATDPDFGRELWAVEPDRGPPGQGGRGVVDGIAWLARSAAPWSEVFWGLRKGR